MILVVQILDIRTAHRGFSCGGGFRSYWNERLNLTAEPEWFVRWQLDPETNTATSQFGQRLRMRPFIGNLGMPSAEAGRHSTFPPRLYGGNLDCDNSQSSRDWASRFARQPIGQRPRRRCPRL
jgi:acetamidase/formamidase